MNQKYYVFFMITLVFVLLVPTMSHSSLNNDDRCYFCISSASSLSAQSKVCEQLGSDWFHRGGAMVGATCSSPYCAYTFKIYCSREALNYSLPLERVFDTRIEWAFPYFECSDCNEH